MKKLGDVMSSLSKSSSAFESAKPSNQNFFLSKNEKFAYGTLKEKIQNAFLLNTESNFKTIIKTMNLRNTGTCDGLTKKNLQRLKNNIECSGFIVHLENEVGQTKVTISFPEPDLNKSGRRSPGWSKSFKASAIKKASQKPEENSAKIEIEKTTLLDFLKNIICI